MNGRSETGSCRRIAGLSRPPCGVAISRQLPPGDLTAVAKMALSSSSKFGADHAALDDAVSGCDVRAWLNGGSCRPRRQGSGAARRQPIAAGASPRELQIQDDGGPARAVPFRAVLV